MHVNQVRIRKTKEEEKSTLYSENNQRIETKDGVDYWEEQASEWGIDDIDRDIFEQYLDRVCRTGRITLPGVKIENCKDVLERLFLLRGDRLKNAGAVLFCNQCECELQMAVFAGCIREELLDSMRCRGTIFHLAEAAVRFIFQHLEMDWSLNPIIHEALMNAFCHRDFNSRQCNEVLIFSDRMEVYNPGCFPEECCPEDYFKGGRRPVKRNPLIDSVLYYSGDVSGFGMGLHRIVNACGETGIKPDFRKEETGFTVVFSGCGLQRKKKQQEQMSEMDVLMAESVDLSQKELIIMNYLQQHEFVTNAIARELVHVGTTAARNLLNGLVAKRLLIASGEHRGRKYRLYE